MHVRLLFVHNPILLRSLSAAKFPPAQNKFTHFSFTHTLICARFERTRTYIENLNHSNKNTHAMSIDDI